MDKIKSLNEDDGFDELILFLICHIIQSVIDQKIISITMITRLKELFCKLITKIVCKQVFHTKLQLWIDQIFSNLIVINDEFGFKIIEWQPNLLSTKSVFCST